MSSTPPPSDLSARRLAAVVASLHEAVLVEDATRRVQLANHAFCRIFGRIFGRIDGPDAVAGTDGRRIALELKTLFLNPDGFAAGIEAAIAAGVPRHGDLLPLADGRVLEREYLPLTGDDLPEASRHGHLWKYRDITARVREHARAETLSAVAAGLIKAHGADSTDSADSEEAMCEKVLQTLMTLGWQAGTVFLRAPQPVLLAGPRAAAPPQLTPAACRADQLSIERADQYRYLTHRAPFDADAGVIGDAWAHGRAHWLPDLAAAPACIRVDQARAIGLGTLVFVPIRAGHTSIGVLEVASTRTRAVDADVLRVLTEVGDRLGHVIERMRAHTQRGTQEAWTQTLLDRIAEGVMVIDGPSGEIVGANARAERMWGFAHGAMKSRHVRELMPDGPWRQDPHFPQNVYDRIADRTTEWDVMRLDGTVFPVELQLTAFDTGRGQVLVCFVTDLTERNAVDRLKKQFVATVSHELRTPLTSIRGSLGLLATGALGDLSPQAADIVALAERNVVRLVGLINDILDLERLQTQGLRVSPSTMALDPALARACDAVRAAADEHHQMLALEPTTLTVCADESRLVQIAGNLLSNAVKFSPEGGTIDIAAQVTGGFARIEVRDQGPGVPEGFEEKIFEPFRQVESSDARPRGGSGLGLAIARAIVREHGGAIGYEPRPGGGSIFWFTVPLAGDPS